MYFILSVTLLSVISPVFGAYYNLYKSYAGDTFFDQWSFYGSYDNLTNGDVTFLDRENATTDQLAYINSEKNAIIKVDNTTDVLYNYKRNSIRLESYDAYPLGTVLLIDVLHLPYGCSVWPAIWTHGTDWPLNGEIDIIEGINLQSTNQMAIHTTSGCTKSTGGLQSGTNGQTNCSSPAGCTVVDNNPNSYGPQFEAVGGGMWATQFDTSGISIWFWERANIPSGLTTSSNTTIVDPTSWGTPSAAYTSDSSCDYAEYFGPQKLIITITLCGDWAGAGAIYNASTCYSTVFPNQGLCYQDNVIGDGSNYDDAYFEIPSIRAFVTAGAQVENNQTASNGPTSTKMSPSSSATSTAKPNGAVNHVLDPSWMVLLGLLIASVLAGL